MRIRFNCTNPSRCPALVELDPLESAGGSIRCPRCGHEHPVHLPPRLLETGVLDECPLCRCRELFVRKDFPQKLGLAIVIVAAGLSLWFFPINVFYAWLVLGAAIAVDVVIHLVVGNVTCCYACRAEYRRLTQNPKHESFDLARSEKY